MVDFLQEHFFHRPVEKGKHKKLAIIAVCNKLLKQVFAVVDQAYCTPIIIIKISPEIFFFDTVRIVCLWL